MRWRLRQARLVRFNTQPPEGGCHHDQRKRPAPVCFNTQPPEGGCVQHVQHLLQQLKFQHTATRRWLLFIPDKIGCDPIVSTHSHPKVAAVALIGLVDVVDVSTHSHPKVAALGNYADT